MKGLFLGVAVLAVSQPGGGVQPPGPPPQVAIALLDDNRRPVLQREEAGTRVEQRTEQVEVNGQVRQQQVNVRIPIRHLVRHPLDGPRVAVYDTDGQRIDPKELPQRLTKPTPVLVSADGKKVDPFYLRVARPGTLVVVSPDLVVAPPVPPGPPLPGGRPASEALPPPKDKAVPK